MINVKDHYPCGSWARLVWVHEFWFKCRTSGGDLGGVYEEVFYLSICFDFRRPENPSPSPEFHFYNFFFQMQRLGGKSLNVDDSYDLHVKNVWFWAINWNPLSPHYPNVVQSSKLSQLSQLSKLSKCTYLDILRFDSSIRLSNFPASTI